MRFYVGTYTLRGSKGIYAVDLDKATGALNIAGATGGVANPSFLAVHPRGKFLYAASETDAGPGKSGGVAALAIPTTGDGIPVLLNQQSARGGGTCFIAVDPAGRNVMVANYGSGSLAVLPIGSDGRLQPASAFVQDKDASKVNAGRQEAPHAHAILTDPAGRFVVAADLGCDRVFVFRYDSRHGTLTPNNPPAIVSHPGSGPRHIAFAPDGRFAYVIHEMAGEIVTYQYNNRAGTFTEKQSISTLPSGWSSPNTTAEIAVHPSGRFVYGSNRGHDSIAAFAVDKTSGMLRLASITPSRGKTPRGFALDPAGHFLVVAHQDTDNLVAFRIDQTTGALTPTGGEAKIPAPVCVVFGPLA